MESKHSAKRYETKEGQKRKIKFNIRSLLMLVFVVLLIFSGVKIIKWIFGNKQNEEVQNNLSQYVDIKEDENNKEDNTYKIDFKALKEKNSDTIGWLKVNGTNIEYVVVKGTDNDYYLSHNFEKQNNSAGWIFADYRNKFDYTDYNTVIYGHNMKNDSMFGTLKNVLSDEWYNNEENRHIILVTEKGTFTYEVFSVYEEKASDYPIQTGFSNDNEYLKFLNTIKDRSVKDFNVELSAEKGIITLSRSGRTIIVYIKQAQLNYQYIEELQQNQEFSQ